jgi:hypothetical protein
MSEIRSPKNVLLTHEHASDPDNALEICGKAFRDLLDVNTHDGTEQYRAVVLTDAVEVTCDAYNNTAGLNLAESDYNLIAAGDPKENHFQVRCRILEENSPHQSIPLPESISTSPEDAQLTALHPIFVTRKSTKHCVQPNKGDVVWVTFEKGPAGGRLYNGQILEDPAVQAHGSAAPAGPPGGGAANVAGPGGGGSMGSVSHPASPRTVDSPPGANTTISATVTDNPNLIYFYPGVGYGTKPFVNRVINKMNIPANTIIILGNTNKTSFSSLRASAEAALGGKTPASIKLGGWSGGAIGLADAINSGLTFDTVIYADPSPRALIGKSHGNAKMYYNPKNWKGDLKHLVVLQNTLAADMGGGASLVADNHNVILENTLKELMG